MRWEILDSARTAVLPRLAIAGERGFFLAGGTAVALRYGHRVSEDFDFFRAAPFLPGDLFRDLGGNIPGMTLVQADKNTLTAHCGPVKLSFFGGISDAFLPFSPTAWFPVADMPDVACMKLWAMMNREAEKDYADMAVILRQYPLADVLVRFRERHGDAVSPAALLKALTYFGDIRPGEVTYLEPGLDFEKVKTSLSSAVSSYIRPSRP